MAPEPYTCEVEHLLAAIVAGDLSAAEALLGHTPALAAHRFSADRLIENLHWLYVGDTFLHLAAAALQPDLATLLIEYGTETNAINRRKASPLHYACDPRPNSGRLGDPSRQSRVIGVLLSAGARIDAADAGGATPLHRAVRARGLVAVRTLLAAGARVDLRLKKEGSTPLHLAVYGSGAGGTADTESEQLEIIAELLRHGADVLAEDARGRTVIASAKSSAVRLALQKLHCF
jgi:ankyrin repeat protein